MNTHPSSNRSHRSGLFALLFATLAATCSVQAQSSAFTYQGYLTTGSSASQGGHDLRFTLHNALSGGAVIAGPLTNANVTVSNGLFTATLDFGAAAFDGSARWLEIGVRTNGSASAFAVLAPRQPVTTTPYAVRAANLSGNVNDAQLSGNIPRLNGSATFSSIVQLTNAANVVAGNGSGLTSLDAGNITAGSLPNARLSADVARRSGGNTFTGNQTFTNGPVGIGMAPTSYPLSLKGNGTFSEYLRLQNSDGTNRWHLSGQNNGLNFVETGVADYRLFLAPGGNVGVGTSIPAGKLHVATPNITAGILDGSSTIGTWLTLKNTAGGTNWHMISTGSGNGEGAGKLLFGFGPALGSISGIIPLTLSPNGTVTPYGLHLPTAFGPDANYVGTAGNHISFGHVGVSEDFIGYKNNTFYFRDSPGGADTAQPNVVVGGELTAVAVNITSDRHAKKGFKPVNAREVLEKVAALPISEWQYKTQEGRHIGPMAQDFHAAFAVGRDDLHITTVDADGVALAAIQGLNEKLVAEVRDKEQRIRDLERAVTQLQTIVGRLAETPQGVSK